ncbi:MAG: helix-turn-helix domain-containing protein [Deltaproteobacteria bacterium]|nr:helix-turn-helix domain-containing protein [Deltaproteobacteria bacterium]
MIERNITVMSIGEVRRLKAVQSSIGGQVTQKTVAAILGLSERQVRRLVRDVRERGDRGIIHALRGRQSNRGLSEEVRGRGVIPLPGAISRFLAYACDGEAFGM